MSIRAIIFDYYGVIQPDPLQAAYRKFGGDPERDRGFIIRTIEASNKGQIKSSMPIFAERLGISLEVWKDEMAKSRIHDTELLDYIISLRKSHKVGLLSNMGKGGLQIVWQGKDLNQYFDVAIASGDVGLIKPQPEIFELMAQKFGVKTDECIMIDDIERYCQGARDAGMQAILYQGLHKLKPQLQTLLIGQSEKPIA